MELASSHRLGANNFEVAAIRKFLCNPALQDIRPKFHIHVSFLQCGLHFTLRDVINLMIVSEDYKL